MVRREVLTLIGIVVATAAGVLLISLLRNGTAIGSDAPSPEAGQPTATASTSTSNGPVATSEPPPGEVTVNLAPAGDVDAVRATPQQQTVDAAVGGFVTSAHLMLTSPEVTREPEAALSSISEVLNVTDRELLKAIDRTKGVEFSPSAGAYRVLGHAGDEDRPDKVMVEVVAPLQIGDADRWVVTGGVVAYVDGRWQIESIRPTEPAQPEGSPASLREMTPKDRAKVLDGAGWRTFADADR